METLIDRLTLLWILTDVALLGLGRLGASIGLLAVQGVLLAALALGTHGGAPSPRVWVIAVASLAVRSALFPWLLRRVARQAGVGHERNPLVGYPTSTLTGIVLLGVAIALGERLHLETRLATPLVVPAALFTLFTGVFLVVARRKALSQCLGYLVMENGIFGFGVAAVGDVPALVELGALLDLFVAVLVMGVAMYRLTEEFDHMDTDRLDTLRG